MAVCIGTLGEVLFTRGICLREIGMVGADYADNQQVMTINEKFTLCNLQ